MKSRHAEKPRNGAVCVFEARVDVRKAESVTPLNTCSRDNTNVEDIWVCVSGQEPNPQLCRERSTGAGLDVASQNFRVLREPRNFDD